MSRGEKGVRLAKSELGAHGWLTGFIEWCPEKEITQDISLIRHN